MPYLKPIAGLSLTGEFGAKRQVYVLGEMRGRCDQVAGAA